MEMFPHTINIYDIFSRTGDINAIVSRHVETIVELVNIGVKPDYTVRLELDVEEFYNAVGQDKRGYIHSEEYKKIKEKYIDK